MSKNTMKEQRKTIIKLMHRLTEPLTDNVLKVLTDKDNPEVDTWIDNIVSILSTATRTKIYLPGGRDNVPLYDTDYSKTLFRKFWDSTQDVDVLLQEFHYKHPEIKFDITKDFVFYVYIRSSVLEDTTIPIIKKEYEKGVTELSLKEVVTEALLSKDEEDNLTLTYDDIAKKYFL